MFSELRKFQLLPSYHLGQEKTFIFFNICWKNYIRDKKQKFVQIIMENMESTVFELIFLQQSTG